MDRPDGQHRAFESEHEDDRVLGFQRLQHGLIVRFLGNLRDQFLVDDLDVTTVGPGCGESTTTIARANNPPRRPSAM